MELSGPVRVDRDPCVLCGVRGDVGCSHRPATPAEPFVEPDPVITIRAIRQAEAQRKYRAKARQLGPGPAA